MAKRYYKGGDGGVNGSDGEKKVSVDSFDLAVGGSGSELGGTGGSAVASKDNTTEAANGLAGVNYGDGGGGAGAYYDSDDTHSYTNGKGGSGAQGVVYIRVPKSENRKLISFTIDGETFYSPSGYTWNDWIYSKYGESMGLSSTNGKNEDGIYDNNWVLSANGMSYLTDSNAEHVNNGDLIIEKEIYTWVLNDVPPGM